MRAVIHIGTPKTGTTTIQSFLDRNRQSLKKQGVFIPAAGIQYFSRSRLSAATCLIDARESCPLFHGHFQNGCVRRGFLSLYKKYFTAADQEKQKQKCRREIEKFCRKDGLAIFSNENFSLFIDNEVERLKELLNPLFDDVMVVIYLRRQPECLVSLHPTIVWNGTSWSILDYLNVPEERSLLAYHPIVKRWSIFGKNKVKVRIFDKKAFHENDLLSDFAATAGFDLTGLVRVKNRKEAKLGSAEVEFMRSLNSHIPVMIGPFMNNPDHSKQVRKFLEDYALNNPGDSKKAYHFSRAEAGRILEQFREGNDWIAREFLGQEHLFDDDLSMYSEEVVSGHQLTHEKWGEITAYVLREMRKRQVSYWFRSLRVWMQQKITKH